MKYIIITTPATRHNYVTKKLCEFCKPELIAIHERDRKDDTVDYGVEYNNKNAKHFENLREAEKRILGEHNIDDIICDNNLNTSRVVKNQIKESEFIDKVCAIEPDVIFTLGCGIIPKEIHERFLCVNFHIGMSPRYKGSAGIFWALYNMDPERVAVSILQIIEGIDNGPIIYHSRPDMHKDDSVYDISAKAIMQGADDLCKVASIIDKNGAIDGKIQKGNGRDRKSVV